MRPVKVEVFEGTSQLAINRRGKNKQGRRGIIPDPQGPMDEKVWVLKLTPENGDSPAVVFSFACHPVIVYGYAFAAISPDFPGATRNVLRETLGEKAHVQFVQGSRGTFVREWWPISNMAIFALRSPGTCSRRERN